MTDKPTITNVKTIHLTSPQFALLRAANEHREQLRRNDRRRGAFEDSAGWVGIRADLVVAAYGAANNFADALGIEADVEVLRSLDLVTTKTFGHQNPLPAMAITDLGAEVLPALAKSATKTVEIEVTLDLSGDDEDEDPKPEFDEQVIVGALATIADRDDVWVLREPFDITSPGLITEMLDRSLLGATISPGGHKVVSLSKKGMEMLRNDKTAALPMALLPTPAKRPVPDLRTKPIVEQAVGTVSETEALLQEEERVRGVLGLLESRMPHAPWTHVGECALSEIFHAKDYEAGGLLDEMIEAGVVEAEDFGSVRHIRITGKGLDVLDRSNGKTPPEPDKDAAPEKPLPRPEDVELDDTDIAILAELDQASPVAPTPESLATAISAKIRLVLSALDRLREYQLVAGNDERTVWTITDRGRAAFATPAEAAPSDSERRLGSPEIGPLPPLDRSKMPIENIHMDNDGIAMLNLLRKNGDSAGRDLAKCCAVAANGVLVLKRLREYGLLTLAAPGYYDDPGARWKLTPRGSDMVSRIAQEEQEYDHGVEQAEIERRYVEDTALGERIAEARERQSRRPRPEKPHSPTPGTIVTFSQEEKERAERDWKTLRDATRILRGTDPRLAAQVEEAATDLADLIIAIGERVQD